MRGFRSSVLCRREELLFDLFNFQDLLREQDNNNTEEEGKKNKNLIGFLYII